MDFDGLLTFLEQTDIMGWECKRPMMWCFIFIVAQTHDYISWALGACGKVGSILFVECLGTPGAQLLIST